MMKKAVNDVQAEIALETAFQTLDETHEAAFTEGEDGQDVPFLEEEQSVKKKKTTKKKLDAAKSQSKDQGKEKKKDKEKKDKDKDKKAAESGTVDKSGTGS